LVILLCLNEVKMDSKQIQQKIYEWALGRFTAPYGVLSGEHLNKKGKKYLSVTFGRARTLDASVDIYNRNFMILRTSRGDHDGIYKDYTSLMEVLEKL